MPACRQTGATTNYIKMRQKSSYDTVCERLLKKVFMITLKILPSQIPLFPPFERGMNAKMNKKTRRPPVGGASLIRNILYSLPHLSAKKCPFSPSPHPSPIQTV